MEIEACVSVSSSPSVVRRESSDARKTPNQRSNLNIDRKTW